MAVEKILLLDGVGNGVFTDIDASKSSIVLPKAGRCFVRHPDLFMGSIPIFRLKNVPAAPSIRHVGLHLAE